MVVDSQRNGRSSGLGQLRVVAATIRVLREFLFPDKMSFLAISLYGLLCLARRADLRSLRFAMLVAGAQNKLSANKDLDRRLRLGGGNQVVKHSNGKVAYLALRHVDGRQTRLHGRTLRKVVEADDRDVLGN